MLVTLSEIRAARARIQPFIENETPLVSISAGEGKPKIYAKLECLQNTGSFKIRGAAAVGTLLSPEVAARGVVAHSSGNHAQGVARFAKMAKIPAVIVMPENSSPFKQQRVKADGAELVLVDTSDPKWRLRSAEIAQERGMTLIHPYDNLNLIAGQGTAGLEIFGQMPDVERVLVPVSGGGLISGIAAALKELNPNVEIYGVEPELACDAWQSMRYGARSERQAAVGGETIADGLRAPMVGEHNWAHIKNHVTDILLVSELDIVEAMRHLRQFGNLVVEPSGAVSVAGALKFASSHPAKTVAVISGGNISTEEFEALVA